MIPVLNTLLRYGFGGGGIHPEKWTQKDWNWFFAALAMFIGFFVVVGGVTIIRYRFKSEMVRRKMRWSFSQDSFWNYDSIVDAAKSKYLAAQLLLNSNAQIFLKRLTPYNRAKLLLFKKQIRSENDIEFLNAYIVCFDDKKNNAADSVAVYLELLVKNTAKCEEILIMHRYGNDWKITEYVKRPSIYMISYSRSVVEKS